ITLNEHKKSLMESRFHKRLAHYKINSFGRYYQICNEDVHEKIEMLNLITTNETYFFREKDHFDFLKEYLINYQDEVKLRIWSAACSVGAEAYSIAMFCDTLLPSNMWEVFGSDINNNVVKKARMGLYPIVWSDKISLELRHKYCLKGKGKYEGQFLIDRQLAKNVRFQNNNLLEVNHSFGEFNIVFLRNVLIYFNNETRNRVIKNIMQNMKQGSLLIISQTENLNGLDINKLEQVTPSIFKVK
ncbi:MAG: protein-glutamate O-methyltransferase CheR, partial [Sulfurimonas sp.]|nr:protein-glutamate O-methyltransferase CheR [Sulfurimonas sp.]